MAPSAGPQGRLADRFSPLNQGFDLNVGGTAHGGPPSFFSPYRIATLPDGEPGEYLPDRLVNETIEFIQQHKDRPWMAQLWFYTVHWPMQAPQPLLEKYADRRGPGLNDTRYGAMIEAMDLAIGRLLAALDAMRLSENTLVVFTSDNGGFAGVSDCRPLREAKGYLYEGGIRVPLMVRWPGRVAAGSTSAEPVISMDFFSTFLEVAGLAPDPVPAARRGQPAAGACGNREAEPAGALLPFPELRLAHGQSLGVRHPGRRLQANPQLRRRQPGAVRSEKRPRRAAQPGCNAVPLADRLQRQLVHWLRQTGAPMPRPPNS